MYTYSSRRPRNLKMVLRLSLLLALAMLSVACNSRLTGEIFFRDIGYLTL